MSFKLNTNPKKKKKSAVLPRTRNAKLLYQLKKQDQRDAADKEIAKINDTESKQSAKKLEELFGNNKQFRPKKTAKSGNVATVPNEPALILVNNSAANDRAEPISIDYVHDTTDLNLPLRIPELFVLCVKCNLPVSTGLAGRMIARSGKFSYEHVVCQKP